MTSFLIHGQKNLFLKLANVIQTTMCPALRASEFAFCEFSQWAGSLSAATCLATSGSLIAPNRPQMSLLQWKVPAFFQTMNLARMGSACCVLLRLFLDRGGDLAPPKGRMSVSAAALVVDLVTTFTCLVSEHVPSSLHCLQGPQDSASLLLCFRPE